MLKSSIIHIMPHEPSSADFESMVEGLKSTGMSYGAISKQSGVSRTTVWRIAVGEARQPSYDTWRKIERVWTSNGKPLPNRSRR